MKCIEYCQDNNIDISMFATEGQSIVSTEDERVVYAIEELLSAGFTHAAISADLHLSASFIASISKGAHHDKVITTGKILDVGKIKALHRAGWNPVAISYDVGCSLEQVQKVLYGK